MLTPSLALLLLMGAEPDAKLLEAAAAQARTCSEAIFKEDFEKLLDMTHPRLVALAGGREPMLKRLRAEIDGMKSEGVTFDSSTITPPSALQRTKDGLFCLVPLTLRLKVKDRKIRTTSALVGMSTDGGKSWIFLDTTPGEKKLRQLFPEIPKEIEIPKPVKPVLDDDSP